MPQKIDKKHHLIGIKEQLYILLNENKLYSLLKEIKQFLTTSS